jgi:preprotein translocase subunit SecD
MKIGKIAAVLLVLLVTAASAVVGLNYLGEHLRLGLDLRGGVQVRIQAVGEASQDEMDKIISTMNLRINSLGVTEPTIQQEGSNRVLIELPGVQDPEEALEIIGRTAYLTFATFDEEHNLTVVLDGSHLADARETNQTSRNQFGAEVQEFVVLLEFDSVGRQVFADLTGSLVAQYAHLSINSPRLTGDFRRNIAIFLDDEMISMPFVSTAISDGKPVITGSASLAEARQLALLLKSGALPVPVEVVEKRTIGPTLGADSIAKSQTAGIVGLALVILFMLAFYRLPGVIAGFSLVLYTVLLLGVMALLRVTLTLPGILGVMLSIGMCMSNNIIIYERIKEELTVGKTLRASVSAGFSRAFMTIVDSNVTTLIAAAVLFVLGTGKIKGFAVTLTIGIIISMFTSIVYTRFLLKNLAESGLFATPWLYGWKEAAK